MARTKEEKHTRSRTNLATAEVPKIDYSQYELPESRAPGRPKGAKNKPKPKEKPPKSPYAKFRQEMIAQGQYVEQDGRKKLKVKNPIGRDRDGRRMSTKEWMDRFIKALRGSHNVTYACNKAGITRHWAYIMRKADPKFAQRWQDAWEEGIDDLEEEAHRRAMEGSDLLMIFMLKGNRGSKYRDRVAPDSASGIPVNFTFNIAAAKEADQPALPPPDQPEGLVYDVKRDEYSEIPVEEGEGADD